MKDNNKLDTLHYFSLIALTMAGNGLFSLPRDVADRAGRAAWLVVLLAGILVLIVSQLTERIASRFPDMDAGEWPKILLGPILGRVWLILFFLKTIMVVYMTGKLFANILRVRQYYSTPTVLFAILITLLTIYLVTRGMGAMGRFSLLVLFVTLPTIVFVLFALRQGELTRLLPLGVTPLAGWLQSLPQAIYSNIGWDIIWFAYPCLKRQQEARRGSVAAVLLIMLIYTLLTAAAIMNFGPDRLRTLLFPSLALISRLEFALISRVDTLVLNLWQTSIVVTAASFLYISSRLVQGVWSRLRFRPVALVLGLLVAAVQLIEVTPRQLAQFNILVSNYGAALLLTSILTFTVLTIVGKGGHQRATRR